MLRLRGLAAPAEAASRGSRSQLESRRHVEHQLELITPLDIGIEPRRNDTSADSDPAMRRPQASTWSAHGE